MECSLRLADSNDCKRIFDMRNDPWIVSLGTSQKAVEWKEHVRWFDRILKNPDCQLWLIEPAMGTVRVMRNGDFATATIYLLKKFTGKGVGPWALREACNLAFCRWNIKRIKAHIRYENRPSLVTFLKVGFFEAEEPSADCPLGHTEVVLENKGR